MAENLTEGHSPSLKEEPWELSPGRACRPQGSESAPVWLSSEGLSLCAREARCQPEVGARASQQEQKLGSQSHKGGRGQQHPCQRLWLQPHPGGAVGTSAGARPLATELPAPAWGGL